MRGHDQWSPVEGDGGSKGYWMRVLWAAVVSRCLGVRTCTAPNDLMLHVAAALWSWRAELLL